MRSNSNNRCRNIESKRNDHFPASLTALPMPVTVRSYYSAIASFSTKHSERIRFKAKVLPAYCKIATHSIAMHDTYLMSSCSYISAAENEI
mmetsp:Transcript_30316/g.43362  ORF Transcript_30316/g.43362 Transcript_30316/m.43362 type:complete len:91 (+) Transcript_30316:1676-1948(+)